MPFSSSTLGVEAQVLQLAVENVFFAGSYAEGEEGLRKMCGSGESDLQACALSGTADTISRVMKDSRR